MLRVLNVLYPMVVIVVLIFSYASSIIACQARLEAMHPKVCKLSEHFTGRNISNKCHLYVDTACRLFSEIKSQERLEDVRHAYEGREREERGGGVLQHKSNGRVFNKVNYTIV